MGVLGHGTSGPAQMELLDGAAVYPMLCVSSCAVASYKIEAPSMGCGSNCEYHHAQRNLKFSTCIDVMKQE